MKRLTQPYVSISMGVQTPETIDATLCVIPYGGLEHDAALCVNLYGGSGLTK